MAVTGPRVRIPFTSGNMAAVSVVVSCRPVQPRVMEVSGLFLTYNVALETTGHVNCGHSISLLSQHSGHLMKIQCYIGPLGFTFNGSPGPF